MAADHHDRCGIVTWDICVAAGSWRPEYIVLLDPDTRLPLDVTAGFSARMVIANRSDGRGQELAELTVGSGLRLAAEGRLYFEPAEAVTSAWTWRRGHHHIELTHPSGRIVRVAAGPVTVSPELVTD